MADLNAILDSIKELKLLEVAELVKMMEDEFGRKRCCTGYGCRCC